MMRTVNQFSLHPILEIFSQKSFHNSFHLFSHKSPGYHLDITFQFSQPTCRISTKFLGSFLKDSILCLSSYKFESRVCYLKTKSVCIPENKWYQIIISYIDWNWTVKNYHFLRHNIWLMLSASSQKSYSWFTSIFFFLFFFLRK